MHISVDTEKSVVDAYLSSLPMEEAASRISAKRCVETASVPEPQRLSMWRDIIGKTLNFTVEVDDAMPFSASAEILPVGHCTMARVTTTPASYNIAKANVRAKREIMTMAFVKEGRAHIRQKTQRVTISDGEATLFFADEIGTVLIPEQSIVNFVQMPLIALAAQVPDLALTVLQPLDDDNHALMLLDHYVSTLVALNLPISNEFIDIVSSHVTDLAGNALCLFSDKARRHGKESTKSARKRAIKADILAHHAEQDLASDHVSGRLGITPRYMRKLLKEDGTSFSDLTRHIRLKRARSILLDPKSVQRSVTSIANEVGFGDLSYFNRSFRRYYGVSPSSARRKGPLIEQ